MTSGSTTKARRAQARRAEPIPAETTPAEAEWATEDDLPAQEFYDVTLPDLGKKVRIRFLNNLETAELGALPDLLRFAELMGEKFKVDNKLREDPLSKEERRTLRREQVKYGYMLAHIAVMHPEADIDDVSTCPDCGMDHPPALWTRAQAKRLSFRDLTEIAGWAERGDELARVRPLSQDETDSASSPPADTGESTPPTNSD